MSKKLQTEFYVIRAKHSGEFLPTGRPELWRTPPTRKDLVWHDGTDDQERIAVEVVKVNVIAARTNRKTKDISP